MAAFVLTFEWWHLVLFSVMFWLCFMGAYWYGQHTVRSKNSSRNSSHYQSPLFDDLAEPSPPPPPPPPRHDPEMSPWIAYDDGTWQRMCTGGCKHGMLANPQRLCSRCNGSGYEVTNTNPHGSSREMLQSPWPEPGSESTTNEVTEVPSEGSGRVTYQWPPRDLIEPW